MLIAITPNHGDSPMTHPARSLITKRAAEASVGTNLSSLSITELVIFHAAALASAAAWMAIANQPRAQGELVQAILDTDWVRCNGLLAAAVDELRARHPLDRDEATARAQCLLQYAGDWFDWEEASQIVFSAAKFAMPGH